jgi:hypothetical protein
MPFRTVAIPTSLAESVRATLSSPGYGHPAHTEVAAGYGPCRHCLRVFRVNEERRILFTYDAFAGREALPLPGPVFIHERSCERYPPDGGFPDEGGSVTPRLAHAVISRPGAAPSCGRS